MEKLNNLLKNIAAGEQAFGQVIDGAMVVSKKAPEARLLSMAQKIILSPPGIDLGSSYGQKPYLTTNQNQRYLEETLKGHVEKACVIMSSGDTIFELLHRGILDITAVDNNEMQFPVFRLRRAAIKTLNNNEYERFLLDMYDKDFLSKDIFKYVKDGFLPEESVERDFWEKFLTLNPPEDIVTYFIKGGFEHCSLDKIRYGLPYVKKRGLYFKIRENLEKADIKLPYSDIVEYLLQHPEEKFDYINITNILLFVFQYQCDNDLEKFKNYLAQLKRIFDINLNQGGTFVLDYMFSTDSTDLKKPITTLDGTNGITMLHLRDDKIKEILLNIYRHTNNELANLFDTEVYNVENIAKALVLDKGVDTVVLAKKR